MNHLVINDCLCNGLHKSTAFSHLYGCLNEVSLYWFLFKSSSKVRKKNMIELFEHSRSTISWFAKIQINIPAASNARSESSHFIFVYIPCFVLSTCRGKRPSFELTIQRPVIQRPLHLCSSLNKWRKKTYPPRANTLRRIALLRFVLSLAYDFYCPPKKRRRQESQRVKFAESANRK